MTTPLNATTTLTAGQQPVPTVNSISNDAVVHNQPVQDAMNFDKSSNSRNIISPHAAEHDSAALQLRQRTDQRNFSQSLVALAALLGDGLPPARSGSNPGSLIAETLQRVLRAGGVEAVFKPTDPALDAFDTLRQLARQAGVSMRRVRLDGKNWWDEDAGPLLATLKDSGRPVALLPLAGGGYEMDDLGAPDHPDTMNPSRHANRAPLDQSTAAQLDDSGFMFFRKFPARPISLLDLLRFGLGTTGRDSATMVVCGVLAGLLAMFTPFATGILVDQVIPAGRSAELLQLTLMLGAAAVGVAAFELARSLALLRLEGRLGSSAEAAVIDRLLSLPVPFFRNYSAGDLAQRAFSINSILQQLTATTQSIVLNWVFGLFSFFYMLALSWQLGLVAVGLVALILAVTVSVNVWRLRMERQLYALQGAIAGRVLQILNGIGKLRSGAAEHRAFGLWAHEFGQQKRVDLQVRGLGNMLQVFNASFIVLASATLFAAIAFFQKDISTGVFVAFNTAFVQFLSATLALAGALTQSLSIIPLYERAKPILAALPEQQDAQTQAGPLRGDVEISRANFSYADDGPLILSDVSIHVKRGEFVAFVGPSGSGKSTLFRVLLGFEALQSGAVYYDSQDLAGLDVGSVRRQLGVVLQNGKLMPGDIFTNIVGSSSRTLDDAWDAARMAGLAEDIAAMPMGMYTVISEGAGTISGGQRQRLMIARALVNRPAVLLFDEATSALDNQTQAIVAQSIKQLEATRIVIAHRLSTIIQADRIFVIVAGKVVETGNYSQLMALGGHFADLSKRQQL